MSIHLTQNLLNKNLNLRNLIKTLFLLKLRLENQIIESLNKKVWPFKKVKRIKIVYKILLICSLLLLALIELNDSVSWIE